MIDDLATNFKMGFSDFRSHATSLCIFQNPSSLEVSGSKKKFHLELTELQYDTVLRSNVNKEALITFLLPYCISVI
jgi:hypothetical protein